MPSHYSVSIQPTDAAGVPSTAAPLNFNISNHDDLFAILRKVEENEAVPSREAAEFVIGLKLLLEVMIRHRKDALFEGLWPHMADFVKRLKAIAPRAAKH